MKSLVPRSFRRRLPLSYAAIALLNAVALGAVLLFTLRDFYARQERAYMERNAEAIAQVLSPLLQIDPPPDALRSQLTAFSFLTQTRVRLLETDGALWADSGDPMIPRGLATIVLQVRIDQTTQSYSQTVTGDGQEAGYTSLIAIEDAAVGLKLSESTILKGSEPGAIVQDFAAPIGSGLTDIIGLVGERSAEVVRTGILDPHDSVVGYVELSEGPAYGRAILRGVSRGWGIASAVSVLLAALVGWRVSRGLSRPLVALTDITERMADGDLAARADLAPIEELGTLAQSFNRMAGRVEHTVSTLRRFVADAAHAFNTPLTALHTNLELMHANDPSCEQRQLVEQAQQQVERLESTTRCLLDLSRLEAATGQPEKCPIDLVALAESVGEPQASRAEQRGLTFDLALPDDPVVVQGHAGQLRQALDNLLDNSIKFTPAGGTVRLIIVAEGHEANLRVEDTGIGIPAGDHSHLFERFHRGRNVSAYPGSGLGLAITKAIVDRHDGRVSLKSDASGTVVSISLPQADPTEVR